VSGDARIVPGVAVLGCGTIARYQHLPHLRRMRSARLVAAADPDAGIRRQVARRYGIPAVAEAAELLALPGVDALVIASPASFHAEHALLATAANRPFYLEKPLATSAADARRVLAAVAAAATDLVVAIGFNYRSSPVFVEARRLVRTGVLGEPLAIQMLLCEPLGSAAATWRGRRESGGGAALELVSHQVDLLRWLLGTEVEAVVAASSENGSIEQQRFATTLRLAGGVEAHCLALFGAGPRDRVELVGSRATLIVDRHRVSIVRSSARPRKYGARAAFAGSLRALAPLRLRRLVQPSWEPSFARALRTFVDAVRGERDSPQVRELARAADGAASLAVVLAAERAATEGVSTAVESFLPATGG
jgi:1,5-anhydro-D-fructose reductase (1,5-anhydro-D-mannitol-forming)